MKKYHGMLQAHLRQCINVKGIVYMNSRLYEASRIRLSEYLNIPLKNRMDEEGYLKFIEKVSSGLTGRKWTDKEREHHNSEAVKLGRMKNAEKHRGVARSEEAKQNVSKGMTEMRKRNRQEKYEPIINLETKEVYRNYHFVIENTKAGNVLRAVHRHTTAGGYHWAYYDETKNNDYYDELLRQYIEESKMRKRQAYDMRPNSWIGLSEEQKKARIQKNIGKKRTDETRHNLFIGIRAAHQKDPSIAKK
jgi:hypothetical protein